jgi:hypothetical protein
MGSFLLLELFLEFQPQGSKQLQIISMANGSYQRAELGRWLWQWCF